MRTMWNYYIIKKDFVKANDLWENHLKDHNNERLFDDALQELFSNKDQETAEKLIPFILSSNLNQSKKGFVVSRLLHLFGKLKLKKRHDYLLIF